MPKLYLESVLLMTIEALIHLRVVLCAYQLPGFNLATWIRVATLPGKTWKFYILSSKISI